mmetsp:Transcript_99337/g.284179  ORF Transcript_99337/g.284179 Transcript_99337/m.284179 type:complete len:240 (+) Transcript_99337:448-1167(+)
MNALPCRWASWSTFAGITAAARIEGVVYREVGELDATSSGRSGPADRIHWELASSTHAGHDSHDEANVGDHEEGRDPHGLPLSRQIRVEEEEVEDEEQDLPAARLAERAKELVDVRLALLLDHQRHGAHAHNEECGLAQIAGHKHRARQQEAAHGVVHLVEPVLWPVDHAELRDRLLREHCVLLTPFDRLVLVHAGRVKALLVLQQEHKQGERRADRVHEHHDERKDEHDSVTVRVAVE